MSNVDKEYDQYVYWISANIL
ncbi:hypothetical protein TALC_00509 [Thermoplasmatales archaeon BRNA1]|nr:hypothetical protein TALC_00509 [Thermoplasmatales archaeon BRNA1]